MYRIVSEQGELPLTECEQLGQRGLEAWRAEQYKLRLHIVGHGYCWLTVEEKIDQQ